MHVHRYVCLVTLAQVTRILLLPNTDDGGTNIKHYIHLNIRLSSLVVSRTIGLIVVFTYLKFRVAPYEQIQANILERTQ